MAHLLAAAGHEVEVFVSNEERSETTFDRGVTVHRVNVREQWPLALRLAKRVQRLTGSYSLRQALRWLPQAKALAAALERRHVEQPFALVQSADYQATGLFVRRWHDRVHVVRCSSAADLYAPIDKDYSKAERLRGYFERRAMRQADLAYAPSRYLSEHFRRKHNMDVGVIRPPASFAAAETAPLPFSVPERYFVHFGLLLDRKGTGLIAEALPLAWEAVPDLTMVWSGRSFDDAQMQRWRSLWGGKAGQVIMTGPLLRPAMQTVLTRADVAVLPSQVDNLPNTVIESLSLGIPVLGSRGASIDELVEEGRSGHLIDLGDVQGLSDALIKMWRRETPVAKGFTWDAEIVRDMQPDYAVAQFVELVDRHRRQEASGP
jgi:glycosyltransferase involved in cell wall biosynthesis